MQDDALREAHILIVDDQRENLRVLEETLRLADYANVEAIADSRQVLPRFVENPADLIILDLHMAPISGWAVMAQLRPLIPEDEYLPILVVTGDISAESRRRALSAGARDFITKPYSSFEILLRIRSLLETRFLRRQIGRQHELLEEAVRERTRELEEARIEALERLALAAEYRDDQTFQHTERVGELSALLAAELGLNAAEVELLRHAAPLHDLGKIGIPDALLLKPARLTQDEFDYVKRHTTIGAQILAGGRSPVLRLAELLARCHHERWDGSGYGGLKGEEIPLPVRIVTVADVFDSLVHARPYKDAWPLTDAVAEIARQQGRQFDPRVVAAFLSLRDAGALARFAANGGDTI